MNRLSRFVKVGGLAAGLAVAFAVWRFAFSTGAGTGAPPAPGELDDHVLQAMAQPSQPLFGRIEVPHVDARRKQFSKGERPQPVPADDTDDSNNPFSPENLKNEALTAEDSSERLSAVRMISTSWDEEDAIPVLRQAVNDADPDVRVLALKSLAEAASDALPTGTLHAAVDDPAPDVRIAALEILADTEDPQRGALLQRARNDPDEDVQLQARRLLDFPADETDDTTDDSGSVVADSDTESTTDSNTESTTDGDAEASADDN